MLGISAAETLLLENPTVRNTTFLRIPPSVSIRSISHVQQFFYSFLEVFPINRVVLYILTAKQDEISPFIGLQKVAKQNKSLKHYYKNSTSTWWYPELVFLSVQFPHSSVSAALVPNSSVFNTLFTLKLMEIRVNSEILIRGDRRQVSFLSAFIVHATSQEMKSKWANLKESRLVERGANFFIS